MPGRLPYSRPIAGSDSKTQRHQGRGWPCLTLVILLQHTKCMLLDAASQRTWGKMLYFRSTVQSRCLQLPAARVTTPPTWAYWWRHLAFRKALGLVLLAAGCGQLEKGPLPSLEMPSSCISPEVGNEPAVQRTST